MSWNRAWKLRSMIATRIVARNTSMLTRFFDKPWLRSKAVCIPAGVDAQLFSPAAIQPNLLRRQLGVGPGMLLAGCIANLERVKGHPTLLHAAAGFSNVHIALAGAPIDQAYRESLEQLAVDLNMRARVHFLGRVTDIPALCSELDIFVLPTRGTGRGEGFGVALTEAMACGIPSIASAIDGPKDIIESGRSGLLTPPDDIEALRTALGSLVSSERLRHELGEGGRRRIVERFTIEEEAVRTMALYREIFSTN